VTFCCSSLHCEQPAMATLAARLPALRRHGPTVPSLLSCPFGKPPARLSLLFLLLLLAVGQLGRVSASPDAATDPTDVKALCDLYASTGGPGWKGSGGNCTCTDPWAPSTCVCPGPGWRTCSADGTAASDPCSHRLWGWFGVECRQCS
jgi:hypothetical protein